MEQEYRPFNFEFLLDYNAIKDRNPDGARKLSIENFVETYFTSSSKIRGTKWVRYYIEESSGKKLVEARLDLRQDIYAPNLTISAELFSDEGQIELKRYVPFLRSFEIGENGLNFRSGRDGPQYFRDNKFGIVASVKPKNIDERKRSEFIWCFKNKMDFWMQRNLQT